MIKILVLLASALLPAVAAASQTYRVSFFQPSVIAGTELKPGEYKITLEGNKAVISSGGQKVEAAVRVETGDAKFSATSVRYMNGDGKLRVREIRIGNTKTKLVFEAEQGGL